MFSKYYEHPRKRRSKYKRVLIFFDPAWTWFAFERTLQNTYYCQISTEDLDVGH